MMRFKSGIRVVSIYSHRPFEFSESDVPQELLGSINSLLLVQSQYLAGHEGVVSSSA